MKIKRIYTVTGLMSLKLKYSFDSSDHKLEYFPDIDMFGVDGVRIPASNVREVLVEEETVEMTMVHTLPPPEFRDLKDVELVNKLMPPKAKKASLRNRDGG